MDLKAVPLKNWLIVAAAGGLLLWVAVDHGNKTGASPIPAAANTSDAAVNSPPRFSNAKLEKAKAAISKEPVVRDFLLDPANAVELQVAVTDDGSRRYGLADYFCLRLRDLGIYDNEMDVRIVDAAQLAASNGDFRSISLGTVRCRDEARWD